MISNNESKFKSIIISWRKTLKNNLKNFTMENIDLFTRIFCGEGFYVNHIMKVTEELPIWGVDKHWAYGGVLLEKKFPTSSILQDEETELGLVWILFDNPITDLKKYRNYKEFNYTLFNKIHDNKSIILTNLDYEIFKDLYNIPHKVVKRKYFKDIDYIPEKIKDWVRNNYIEKNKHENKPFKPIYEAAIYGYQARKFESVRNWVATGKWFLRDMYTPVAMFQAAYLRYEEWQMFKKYKDNVVYMNTDSIYCDKLFDIETSNEIGKYDWEYQGNNILFFRRSGYIVKNQDGSIKEAVVSGCIDADTITLEEMEKLRNAHHIGKDDNFLIKHTRDEHNNIIDYRLENLFLKEICD